MEVKVESYLIEDTNLEQTLSQEQVEEFKKQAEQLGLEGQKKLFEHEGIIPFHRLSDGEVKIWEMYCSNHLKIKEYSEGVIPLRVLSLVGIAVMKEYFTEIQVWTEFEKEQDPIIVGIKEKAKYLIARWGLSLRPWEEVIKLAKEKWISKARAKLQEEIAEAQINLAKIDSLAEDWVSGKWMGIYV